ncbi:uncharacterized protein LOC124149033 [Haliotis rufescens]|uniref:uncharacterized protein LOC124149033 n=1 Tax=Haliotis rufescens TaxID=6454 RepID=UPI00201F53A9|nr:uncharacterized protein LOC124149033 [Haliotis rufescens]
MTTPYISGKRMPLKATFVASILRGPDMSKVIRRAPIAPRGGDVFVFCIENNAPREAWKNDNIHFHHDGTRGQPKTNPIVRKVFFCAMVGDGRWTREFMKHVYTLYHNPNNYVVIHYLGDESISRAVPRHRKPRSNLKKHTTCSSTGIQVDTSELSPRDESSDHQDEGILSGDEVDHEDEEEDYSGTVDSSEPTVEIDVAEEDSGVPQSHMLLSSSGCQSDSHISNVTEASTSTGLPFTSTPIAGDTYHESVPFACLDMMPMTNPLGLLSEVTLSCRPLDNTTHLFNPNEPSTSFAHMNSYTGGGGGSVYISTPSEPEPRSVIPKKRLAMRVEGQETDAMFTVGEIATHGTPTVHHVQPTGRLPKKRRLEFTESSPVDPGPSCVGDRYHVPSDDPGDATDTGQSSDQHPSAQQPDGHCNRTDVSNPSPPSDRTSRPRVSHTLREDLESSFHTLVQNVRNLENMLGEPGLWESNRDTREVGTDPEDSRPTLEEFIQELVASGQLALIVSHVMQMASSWKQKPSAFNSRTNPCVTLVYQICQAWGEDMVTARSRLMNLLGKNSMSESDVKNYYHLVTACVVGAYRTEVPVAVFLTTLSTWPSHMEECDTRSDVEVDESVRCAVARTSLTGGQLKTLEKNDAIDAQVIKAYLQMLASHWNALLPHHCYVLPMALQQLWQREEYNRGMLDKEVLTEYTWILMPYQASDNHWVLLVANVQDGTIRVVNTAPTKHPDVTIETADHWRKYMKYRSSHTGQNLTRWSLEDCHVLEQTDPPSSGVHVLMAAESILRGASPVVMRNCHVRRFRQYALDKILNAANFDMQEEQIGGLDDEEDLLAEDNLPTGADGCPESMDRDISSRGAGSSQTCMSASAVPSCSSASVSGVQGRESPVGRTSPQSPRKRRHSSGASVIDSQDKAIDFSLAQSGGISEDGQPRSSDDGRNCRNRSPTQFVGSHPKEHNYANRVSAAQGAAFLKPTPHTIPSADNLENVPRQVINPVPVFRPSGYLFQSGYVPKHPPPMYPIDNLYRGPGPFPNPLSSSTVQEKPCDMSMQSQIALDSQPSTSSQYSYAQMNSEVEDLRVNPSSSFNHPHLPPPYQVSESAGATYTELSNVRISDLQSSSLITSSLTIAENENLVMKTIVRDASPSPSASSDSSNITIHVVSPAPDQRLAGESSEDGFAHVTRPSTSRVVSDQDLFRASGSGQGSGSVESRAAGADGHSAPPCSDSEDSDGDKEEDLSNLNMLSAVASKDA